MKIGKPKTTDIERDDGMDHVRAIYADPVAYAEWRRRHGLRIPSGILDDHNQEVRRLMVEAELIEAGPPKNQAMRKRLAKLFAELSDSLASVIRDDSRRPPLARPRDARGVSASRQTAEERLKALGERFRSEPVQLSERLAAQFRDGGPAEEF